jgi:hypothetical protein
VRSDVVFDTFALGGICLLLVGMVFSNIVVATMAREWNLKRPKEEHIAPWAVLGKGASNYHMVDKYRSQFGDGTLYKQLKIAYWLCGVGGVLGIGTIVVAKTTGI